MDANVLATNLLRLRKSRGLTQEDVAKAAHLSRSGYRNLEAGVGLPRAATAQALADALDVPLGELFQPVPKLSSVRFRALKRMKSRDDVLYDVGRWLGDVDELERLLGVERRHDMLELRRTALSNRERGLPAVAAAVRAAFGLDLREPVHDICGLLESKGIRVRAVVVATDAFYGLSVAEADGGPAIVVNAWRKIPVEQWIHSAAHELGHLLLHASEYDVSVVEESEDPEAEADEFASHFLMPDAAFQKEWGDARGHPLIKRIFKVKRIFRVSWRSVVYRVAEGRPVEERRALWVQAQTGLSRSLGRTVTKLDEPIGLPRTAFRARPPEPLAMEQADFLADGLARLVRRGVEDGEVSLGRAAEILGVSLLEMRAWAASWTA